MSADRAMRGWRAWRELLFATCTAWLVLQNVAILTLAAWSHPADAWAAGARVARTAFTLGAPLGVVSLAVLTGLALAAWLVHAPAPTSVERTTEVRDGN